MLGRGSQIKPYLDIAYRRRWYIAVPVALGLAVGAVLLTQLPKVYQAQTTILVTPQRVPEEFVQSTVTSRLEELFDARRQLVAWASHDLRAPVSSLQAMLEAVEDGVVEPEHYLPAMQQQVHALRVLIDDLFELAQIDAGGDALQTHGVAVERLQRCVHARGKQQPRRSRPRQCSRALNRDLDRR